MEQELEKLGNLHGLMIVNRFLFLFHVFLFFIFWLSALCHYLIEGMKKSWASVSVEQIRFHQVNLYFSLYLFQNCFGKRVVSLLHPASNYRDYRALYRERASTLCRALFFGDVSSSSSPPLLLLSMPVLQRDVIIASEMPLWLEHLRPSTINYQKLRVLGEAAAMFFLVRTSAGHFLALNQEVRILLLLFS